MHPKTAAAFKELDKSLKEAARLCRRLARLSKQRPPVYWQLAPFTAHLAQQLVWNLEQEKEQLLTVQQAVDSEKIIRKK